MRINYLTQITLTCFLFFSAAINAQNPVLVSDLNSGAEDAFDEFNYKATSYNGDLYFQVSTAETGAELGVLKNGELSILKDLNPGSSSSFPTDMAVYNGLLYFSAEDETNGGALWVTDGSSAGTSMLFDPGDSSFYAPSGLIVSGNGMLYFTYGFMLYAYDGTNFNAIQEGPNFELQWLHNANNYCHYNGEIAFLQKYDSNDIEL